MRANLARLGLLLILVALLVVLVPVNRDLAARANLGQDFLPMWLAAHAVFVQEQPAYQSEPVHALYEAEFGAPVGSAISADELRFERPLTALLPAAPLAFLPFQTARAIWLTLVELLQPALILLALSLSGLRRRLGLTALAGALIYSVLWRYGLEAMISGHLVTLEAVLAAVGMLLLAADRRLWAGLALGVGISLGGVLAPLGLVLALGELRARRWAFPAAAVLAVLVPALLLTAVAGDWPIGWLGVQVAALGAEGPLTPVAALVSTPLWIALAVLLLAYLLWQWLRWLAGQKRDQESQIWLGCLTLALSFALLGPLHPSGPLLLLPSLVLIAASLTDRWGAAGASFVVIVAALILILPWLPLLLEVPLNPGGPWLYWLPLGLSLLGLTWIHWWVVRGPRLTSHSTRS